MLESFAVLSGSYQVHSAASRRQLQADIEEKGISNLEQFLAAAQAVIGVRPKCMLACSTTCFWMQHRLPCAHGKSVSSRQAQVKLKCAKFHICL